MSFARRNVALALAAAVLAAACSRAPHTTKPARKAPGKVFVMGFDGMDPTLARQYLDEGKLPNLKRLSEQGSFATLQSSQPSESPTAWSSFATGANPGKHNIYDFLVRDFDTYLPDLGMVKKEPPEFRWGFFPVKRPKVTSTRGGTSFWVHAGRDGVRSIVLTVPVTFPPEEIEHGEMLAGLPLPDLRGTVGTFYYWATDLTSFEEGNTEFGGYLKTLLFEGGVADTVLKGPENPILKQEERELKDKKKKGSLSDGEQKRLDELAKGKDVLVPMKVKWSEGTGRAEIEIQGKKLALKAGQWSDWVPLTFRFNFLVKVRGMTQFYVARADKELQLYASPVNMDPRDPPLPISKPDDFAPRLAKELGLYRTIGWAESADKALNEGRLTEADFLYDSEKAFEDRERIILKNLERTDWDLFVGVIETTDRISHMMWRLIDPKHPMYDKALAEKHGDAIEKVYRRADAFVGRLLEKMPPDTTFMVMSDHGFHSFRRGVNLNTWLVQNGYMKFEGRESEKKTLADLFGRGKFFEGVDWSQTKAYAVGLGQIYFNLRGREGQGIVSAGAEYKALQDEIRGKLLQVKDPDNGELVFRDVYKRDDIYKGEYLQNAPDLQVGFNDGYRVGWQDTLGGVTRSVVENNNRKWSGDHCATATEISGGVLFSNRKIGAESPSIMDLSPTVLKLLGVPLPGDVDGRPLL
ncbi:MAG TPA: alkaline phosphatase family protein [Vicinamibacteria bacterium]|nr:alkaline phosphatase family protein [Vicinamibacteria bacterium]